MYSRGGERHEELRTEGGGLLLLMTEIVASEMHGRRSYAVLTKQNSQGC